MDLLELFFNHALARRDGRLPKHVTAHVCIEDQTVELKGTVPTVHVKQIAASVALALAPEYNLTVLNNVDHTNR